MATIKSHHITAVEGDYDGTDGPLRNITNHGRIYRKCIRLTATELTAAGVAQNDIIEFCRMKASDSIVAIYINHSEMAASSTMDMGIRTPVAGGDPLTLSKDDLLVDGYNMNTAVAVPTAIHGSGTNARTAFDELLGKELWEQMAVSARPAAGTEYSIIGLVGGADWITAGTETLTLDIWYCAGS